LLGLHGGKKGHGEASPWPGAIRLFADLRTVFFGKVLIAERAMKIHPRPQHMRIDDEYLLAIWTSDFYGLTHGYPSLNFRFWIVGILRPWRLLRPIFDSS
jgi:hypothetical protein